jgi:hypothetical protein
MSWTISIVAHAIWAWLPEITVGLRFASALIGFYLTATLLIRRLHHRMRRHAASFGKPEPPTRLATEPKMHPRVRHTVSDGSGTSQVSSPDTNG